jgi:Glycosyl transferase family 2
MNPPALSVVIPTHNRGRYAIHAIRSVLSIADPALELVVTDTSTDGELSSQLEGPARALLADSRLHYVRPAERLDMTGNHNAALALATGQYVCLIGDDDTISREAMDAARWAQSHAVEVIAPNVVANYVWPDFRSRYFGTRHHSRLYLARRMGACAMHDSATALTKALATAAQGTDGLPKIYHGLVKRSLLEELRSRTGAYFHGSSPDVSGAIGLAVVSRRFMVVDHPLTIPGASGGSNTGRSALNQHKGQLGAESQTQKFTSAGWSTGVPRFFSVETVWAHAAIETLARLDPELVRQYNFARLIGVCRALHPEFTSELDAAAHEACALLGVAPGQFERQVGHAARAFRVQRLRALAYRALAPTPAGRRDFVGSLPDVSVAPGALYSYLQQRALSWNSTVGDFDPAR